MATYLDFDNMSEEELEEKLTPEERILLFKNSPPPPYHELPRAEFAEEEEIAKPKTTLDMGGATIYSRAPLESELFNLLKKRMARYSPEQAAKEEEGIERGAVRGEMDSFIELMSRGASKIGDIYGKEPGSLLTDYMKNLRQSRLDEQEAKDKAAKRRLEQEEQAVELIKLLLNRKAEKKKALERPQNIKVNVGGKPYYFWWDPENMTYQPTDLEAWEKKQIPRASGTGRQREPYPEDPWGLSTGRVSQDEKTSGERTLTMANAHNKLLKLLNSGYDPTEFENEFLSGVEGEQAKAIWLKFLNSPKHKEWLQAVAEFQNPMLRRETGAVIAPHEYVDLKTRFIPSRSDSEASIRAKMKASKNQVAQQALSGARYLNAMGKIYGRPISRDDEPYNAAVDISERMQSKSPILEDYTLPSNVISHPGKTKFKFIKEPISDAEKKALDILRKEPNSKFWQEIYNNAVQHGFIKEVR